MIGEKAVRRRVTSIWSAAASRPWRMTEAVTGSTFGWVSVELMSSSLSSGHEFDVVQRPFELVQEFLDLGVAVRGADEQRPERVLVDALVEEPQHHVGDLLGVAVHPRAVVDDALLGPLQPVEVPEAGGVERDAEPAPELVDAFLQVAPRPLDVLVHLLRQLLEAGDAGGEC